MINLFRKLKTSLGWCDADSDSDLSYLYRVNLHGEPDMEELAEAAGRRMRHWMLIENVGNVILGLLMAIPLFIARRLKRQAQSAPPELDEHGFPMDWRQDPTTRPILVSHLEQSAEDWAIFERWCEAKSFRAFPASPETVLKFLTDPSVHGQRLADVYWAIDRRHDAYYWNEDANPCYYIDRCYSVDVSANGEVTFADHWNVFDWWRRERDVVSLPASPDAVLAFLREPPLSGPNLYHVWVAIGERHDAHYRHEDANPRYVLEREFGVSVAPDGAVSIPASAPNAPAYPMRWGYTE